jgi:uncharacterized membrane protein YeaQ/YmgE (transglycosylase-associated protein family)
MQFLWATVVGAMAGVVAKWLDPSSADEPKDYALTTVLGVVGSMIAAFIGHAVHLYRPNEAIGILASVIGAMIILMVWKQGKYY